MFYSRDIPEIKATSVAFGACFACVIFLCKCVCVVMAAGAGGRHVILATQSCVERPSFQLVIIFPNFTQGDIFQERFFIKLKKFWTKFAQKLFEKVQKCELWGWELVGTGQEVWASNSPSATDFLSL